MNALAYVALLAWPLAAIAIASWLRAPRAAIVCCIAGWLFLPEGGMDLPGPIDLSKINVTNLSMLAGLLLIEPRRLAQLRPSWADLPVAVLCVSAFFSSVSNGLGVYDGLASSLAKVFTWGVPWIVGRACFTTLADLRLLAIGVVIGGLVYVPLCLYEVRMSPQLHRIVYGFFPHAEFGQTKRFGGFRPNVFMQHGLMVGLWMCLSALTGAWMWHAGRLRSILGVPMACLAPVQAVVAVLCKSSGAIVLGFGGGALLLVGRALRSRALLLVLAAAPGMYVAYRVAGGPMTPLVGVVGAAPIVGDRLDSLEYRIEADAILLDHAMKRPLFGWGGYGRHRPKNEDGEELVRTDSLWIITLGQNGLLGLVPLYVALSLPLWTVARRVPAASLYAPAAAPLLILATITSLFACDSLFNAMLSPLYVMAGGGVIATMQSAARRAPAPAPPARAAPTEPPGGAGATAAEASNATRRAERSPPPPTPRPATLASGQPASPNALPARVGAESQAAPASALSGDASAPLAPAGKPPPRDLDSLGLGLRRFAPTQRDAIVEEPAQD